VPNDGLCESYKTVTIEGMVSDSNGTPRSVLAEDPANIFALVLYIPGPLGAFLDELRRDLAPAVNPRAHVSVLPPRPMRVDWRIAAHQARRLADGWAPFTIELAGVEVFPVTNVIYLQLGAGADELRRMHAAMNTGVLAFHEPLAYHPHVTLAQEIAQGEVDSVCRKAQRRWWEYGGPRTFRAERAVFVQNAPEGCWVDLAPCSLGAVAVL
jgi:hypothetical protein